MRRRGTVVWVILSVLLASLLGACGEKGLPLTAEPYRSEGRGFSVRYPEGWVAQDEVSGEEVTFADSQDTLERSAVGAAHNPIVGIVGTTPERLTGVWGAPSGTDSAREMLEYMVENAAYGVEFGEVLDTEVGKAREPGAYTDFSNKDDKLAGRVVVVHLGDWVVVVAGYGQPEAWPEFLPTLEAMLATMTFFPPAAGQ